MNSAKKSFLVSAIVSTFKSERFICGCLEDLTAQTLYGQGELEIVVIDSASPQNEGEIVREFQARFPHIRYIRTDERETVYQAWNRGIRLASGKFVTNANTDDRHRVDAFEIMAGALSSNPGVAAVYADTAITSVENETFETTTATSCFRWPDFSLRQLLRGNFFGPQPMWRRSIHDTVGYFNEELVVAGDYDFALKVAWKGGALHIREVLGLYLEAPTSVEHANQEKSQGEALTLLRHYRSIPLEDIYLNLRTMRSPEAIGAACIDMGNCCILSDFPDLQLALEFYKTAASHLGMVPEIRHNIELIRRASEGEFSLVSQLASHICSVDHPAIDEAKKGTALLLSPGLRLVTNPVDFIGVSQYIHPYAASKSTAAVAAPFRPEDHPFRVIALISAHNEGDVIYHVIGDMIHQGIEVYLINHCSTDNTVAEASKWLGKGLIHIENFPQDAGYPEANSKKYVWSQILKRKEELAAQLDADWFIHSDADEFRESPWPDTTLREGIWVADKMGFSAIDFELLNFRPFNNNFVPGSDVRKTLTMYEGCEDFNAKQIKAWKKTGEGVDIVSSGGHDISFEGRKIFPVKFILRHYPIRSQEHGIRKVFEERKKRFYEEERKIGWHVQYDSVTSTQYNFVYDPAILTPYDGNALRLRLLSRAALAIADELRVFAFPSRTYTSSEAVRNILKPYGRNYLQNIPCP